MTRLRMNVVVLCTIAAGGCSEAEREDNLPDEIVFREEAYDRIDRVDDDGVARVTEVTERPARELGEYTALAERPRDELAESLRMTILHPNGGAYTARVPNWAAADAVIHPIGPIDRISSAVADRPGVTAALAAARDASDVVRPGTVDPVGLVIGADNRTLSNVATAPFNAIARVDVFTSATGGGFRISCTGSYIGPFTFVLAGHCLRFADGAFAQRIVFQRARAGGSIPSSFDCRNGDALGSNDFLAAVPLGYFGDPTEDPLDFAVIDTWPCHSTPVSIPGYTVDSGTVNYRVHGYPLGRCPGAPADGTFMCGMAATGYINGWALESDLDATPGQDGAPWITTNPTRVAGVQVGYREYHDFWRCGFDVCRRNYARRIDGAMDVFIRDIAFDF